MVDIWDFSAEGGQGGWIPCFVTPFNDREAQEVEIF